MKYFVDFAYGSLFKYKEELCGDKVEFYSDDDIFVMALADGLGSGVKANILATLTSKIGVTMLKEKMKLDDVVETISRTLPISPTLNIAYSTFTLIRVDQGGMAYIAEFDNPSVIFLRGGDFLKLHWNERIIYKKRIRETSIQLKHNDNLILISDGYKFAGKNGNWIKPWTYEDTCHYIKKCYLKEMNAKEMTNNILDLFNELYYYEPIDDTTVATLKIIRDKKVVLLSGPPVDKSRDSEIVNKFKNARGKKIICGGTTARIVSRELKKIYKPGKIVDKDIPPVGYIEGVDLVTEGVITLQKATSILEHILNTTDYEVLYKEDGSSKLAKMLYEDSLHIKLMVGKSVNQTNQILELSNKLSNKVDILNHLKDVLIKLGKIVDIEYF
nr:SpoIIE family protein phosphatase [uncultured Terrisporobacter sp.]